MNFNDLTLFQEEASQTLIKGPGINALKHTFEDMLRRGAPNQKNDYGFNGQHFDPAQQFTMSPEFHQDGLSIRAIRYILSVLNVYKNTQVPQYAEIKAAVESEIEKQAPDKVGPKANASGNESVIVYKNVKSYGKIKVHVSEVDNNHTKGLMNSIVSSRLEKDGAIPERDAWGKEGYFWKDKLKYLSRDKEDARIVWIHPEILENILNIYRKKGYEITYEGQETPDASTNSGQKEAGPKETTVGEAVVNKVEGRRIFFRIDDISYEDWNPIRLDLKAKGVWSKAIKYNGNESGQPEYILDSGDERIKDVLEILFNSKKINISNLIDSLGKLIPQTDHVDKDDISFENVKRTADVKIKLIKRVSELEFQQIREILVYTFPQRHQYTDRTWLVGGDYQQFVLLGRLLKNHNFNVDKLREIIKQKTTDGDLTKDFVEGDVPDALWAVVEKESRKHVKSFKNEKDAKDFLESLPEKEHFEIEYLPHFKEMIDEMLPNKRPDITLHQAQKEGIEFLFHRKCAILGDETGLGKCINVHYIQTNNGIYAAEDLWNKFAKNIITTDKGEEWADTDELYVHSMDTSEKIVKGKVVGLYREKIKAPMKEIFTSNGKKIQATLPHKFYTLDGWKAELTIDDYICSSSNQFALETNDFNDLGLTKLLAWQISEGYESNEISGVVTITQNERWVLESIKEIYDNMKFEKCGSEDLFSTAIIKEDNNAHRLKISSKNYQLYLEKLGYEWGHKSATKRIPEFIMQANNEVAKTFLKSYFDAECYVNPKCRQIEITSASEILIHQLSVLLQRFNILCSFSEKMKMATNGKRIKRKYHTLYVCGTGVDKFFKEISLDCDYKLQSYLNINTKPNTNKEGKPVHLILKPFFQKHDIPYRLLDIPAKNYILGKRFATNEMIDRIILGFEKLKSGLVLEEYEKLIKSKWTEKTLSCLENIEHEEIESVICDLHRLRNNDLQYEKVKSVKYIDYDGYVYDLCVETHENYIANNLICHNTMQLIGAAEMKMQEHGYQYPTLILAINDVTAKQWSQEIIKIIGAESANEISFDCNNPKRWTILTYNLFSHKRTGMERAEGDPDDVKPAKGKRSYDVYEGGCMHQLLKAHFGIVIFDELHKIKSNKTARWNRLSLITDSIPIRWGATATISANDALDVKNQLLIINHHLGKLANGKFKKDFAGMKLENTPVGRRYVKGDEAARLEAAERLNKWLHLTGVYMRRKKSDVREMPNLEVGQKEVSINIESYTKKVMERLQRYEDKARSKGKSVEEAEHLKGMIAQRTELATAKVPETIRITEDLVKQGKRVIVFTAFKESAEELARAFNNMLPRINRGYKLLTYISSTKKQDRKYVKDRFNNDPEYKILLMSLKMGSTGIDFPNAASEMVINDYDWTPEQAEQSEGRIYRINTNQDVNIHYVIARGTYDETLFEIVQLKRRVARKIQETREEYRNEKNTTKSDEFLKQLVVLQKQIIDADAKIKKIEAEETQKVLPKGSFKEYYINKQFIN
jgi:intein/homing endonuclease/SNF2 family DNA or RNA helicase